MLTSANNSQEKSEDVSELIGALQRKKKSRKNVTLLRAPRKTTKTFIKVIRENVFRAVDYLHYHKKILFGVLVLVLLGAALYITPGSHQAQVDSIEEFVLLCVWWTGLGILSSIGLGTGLHTFVLYLGPYIAKVTLTATECGTTNFPTRGEYSFVCPNDDHLGATVTYWQVLRKVQLEAFLWGLGTAIGELPPYFVARAGIQVFLIIITQTNEQTNEQTKQTTTHNALVATAVVVILIVTTITNTIIILDFDNNDYNENNSEITGEL